MGCVPQGERLTSSRVCPRPARNRGLAAQWLLRCAVTPRIEGATGPRAADRTLSAERATAGQDTAKRRLAGFTDVARSMERSFADVPVAPAVAHPLKDRA